VPRRLIIDGNNLVRSAARYAAVVERDFDAARAMLIADLGARAADGQDVTVVFDGAGNPFSEGRPASVGGITVIFSPAGMDADSVIESLAATARDAGEDAEVVTSDSATRWTSLGGSVTVTRAGAFALELEDDDAEWRSQRTEKGRGASTLADRLGGDIRARLDDLAGRRRPPRG